MSRTEPEAYWRSLDQLAESVDEQVAEGQAERESPPVLFDSVTRRNFLGIMGASMALAGLSGCRRPVEKIVPYVTRPEEIIPGMPDVYATTMPFGLSAYGLLVSCREGRPFKIEGNPQHPSSLGATDALTQSVILNLYDPDRSRSVRENDSEKSFDDFVAFWRALADVHAAAGGEGLAVLSEPFSSPTLARLRDDFMRRYPKAQWVAWEPVGDETILAAARNLTGRSVRPGYHFDRAATILTLDADVLQTESEHVTAARGFARGRRVTSPDDTMNRLYSIESGYSVTGAAADHRLKVPAGQVGHYLLAMATQLRGKGVRLQGGGDYRCPAQDATWLEAVADDLIAAGSRALIVAGRRQPVWVHELALLINNALGAVGDTVMFTTIDQSLTASTSETAALLDRARSGDIDTLVLLGGNPLYDLPAVSDFDTALNKVAHTIHFHEYVNETSARCEWHLPAAHFLESWGDARAADGTPGVIQPMIEPLLGGKMAVEFYSLLADGRDRRGYAIVRENWQEVLGGGDFEKQWRRVLHDGVWAGAPSAETQPAFRKSWADVLASCHILAAPSVDRLEVNFYPSQLHDGRYANNAWLQELPDPITKLTWANVAQISAATAAELGVENSEVVRLELDGASVDLPIWITPGHVDHSVSLSLGYGRTHAGRVGDNVGTNVATLRSSNAPWIAQGARMTGTGRTVVLANTQDHGSMEGRPIGREAPLAQYREEPEFAKHAVEHPPLKSIYPDFDYSQGNQWGMVIDLNACIGCNACATACQSENNVPVVGREQVTRGREMHWIRNDRYFVGDAEDPRLVFQPVACQHCENAPCEQVCPVAATVHDDEGLNTMNYNRCIGTRYCSNNCPYKVRRFNFFNYVNEMPDLVKMAQNPDVTVRARGVMEKCTFCIQRLNRAKGEAKKEGRDVRDGDVVAACQQACPSEAIQFGNIIDPESAVAQHKQNDRNYELLGEFNVRPRTSYLARLRNANPVLAKRERG